jgi:hypothetical protein
MTAATMDNVPAGHGGGRSPSAFCLLLLRRVSRLADGLPEAIAIELAPVIAGPEGAGITSARVKVVPHQTQDPFLRRLR